MTNATTTSEKQRASKYSRAMVTLLSRGTPVEQVLKIVMTEGIQNLASQAAKKRRADSMTPVDRHEVPRGAIPKKAPAAVRVELEASPELWRRFTEVRGHKDYLFRIEVGASGKLRMTGFRVFENK